MDQEGSPYKTISMKSYIFVSNDHKLGSELSSSPHKEATISITWSFQVCNPRHEYLEECVEFYFIKH